MKQNMAADRFLEFFLLIAAGCSAAFGMLGFCVSFSVRAAVLPMAACSAALLFLPFFFPKASKIAAGLLLTALLAFAACEIIFVRGLEHASEDYGVISARIASADGRILLGIAAAMLTLVFFLCRESRFGLVLAWATCAGIPAALSLSGWGTSLPALLLTTGFSALLFVRCGTHQAFSGVKNGQKLAVRVTAFTAAMLVILLAGTQAVYTGLSIRFADTQKITLAAVETWVQNTFQAKNGFGDYDPLRPLGTPISRSSTLVLEVTADGPFYLRGRIYNEYTGSSWKTSELTDGNPSLETVTGSEATTGTPIIISSKITVTTKTAGQKYLFLPDPVTTRTECLSGDFPSLRSTYPELVPEQTLPVNTTYWVRNYAPNPEIIRRFESRETGSIQNDVMIPSLQKSSVYSSVEGLTDRTIQLAEEITAGCENEFQKAAAIRKWLGENCTYTLDPPQPENGQDFVDFFLFDSRKGYCQHFATAMTMLLRASGVPARYVEGYAAPSVSENGVYEVTDEQAHSWVEYQSSIFGFVTDDPTPAAYLPQPALSTGEDAPSQETASSSQAVSSQSISSEQEPPQMAESSEPSQSQPESEGQTGTKETPDWLFLAGVLLLLALILYGGKTAYRALWFAVLRSGDSRRLVRKLYAHFAASLALMGFGIPRSCTASELAERVRGHMDFGPVGFGRVTRIYEETRYGERAPAPSELADLLSFYRIFPAACRRKLGTVRYLLMYPSIH